MIVVLIAVIYLSPHRCSPIRGRRLRTWLVIHDASPWPRPAHFRSSNATSSQQQRRRPLLGRWARCSIVSVGSPALAAGCRCGYRSHLHAPSVQKEHIKPAMVYTLDRSGQVIDGPADGSGMSVSQCRPLFLAAYDLRDAGAVLHSHSHNALLATLLFDDHFMHASGNAEGPRRGRLSRHRTGADHRQYCP